MKYISSTLLRAFQNVRDDLEIHENKITKKHTLDGYNTLDLVAMSLKAYHIIIFKRIDIEDLVESENYDDFKKLTEKYYDSYTNQKVNKQEWLENWLIDEETYDFLKENLQWND